MHLLDLLEEAIHVGSEPILNLLLDHEGVRPDIHMPRWPFMCCAAVQQ